MTQLTENKITQGLFNSEGVTVDSAVIAQQLAFSIQEKLPDSHWWVQTSPAGAEQYRGLWHDKPAFLRIELQPLNTTEAAMITGFVQKYRSPMVRTPEVYASLLFDQERNLSAVVMEDISAAQPIMSPYTIPTPEEVTQFVDFYQVYRAGLSQPWLEKPAMSLAESVKSRFDHWRKSRMQLFASDARLTPADEALISEVVTLLASEYQSVAYQFGHHHLAVQDVRVSPQESQQYVLTSNLYWGWRAPWYDAVFAQHWQSLNWSSLSDEQWREGIALWEQHLLQLATNPAEVRLLRLALLERAAAGLNLDALVQEGETNIRRERERVTQLLSQLVA